MFLPGTTIVVASSGYLGDHTHVWIRTQHGITNLKNGKTAGPGTSNEHYATGLQWREVVCLLIVEATQPGLP